MPKTISAFVAYLIILGLLLMGACSILAHGSTSTPRPNSLGVEEVYTNPNTYLLAVPLEAVALEDGKYVTIRFAPYNTYALYDESILFCDVDSVRKFEGKSGVVVVTYETRAHTMYRGLGCHELISVFEVK
jgi:hypothetical protein